MKSVVPWNFWDSNHNILQKWLVPTIVLSVSLQNYTFLKHCFKFGTFLLLFLEHLCILRKKNNNPNWKSKTWQLCICVVILCVYFHTQKKPLSWQLFSAIRYAVLGNPSLRGWSGCYFTRVVVQQTKYHPSKNNCKLCAEKNGMFL